MKEAKLGKREFFKQRIYRFFQKISDCFKDLSKEIRILSLLTAIVIFIAFLPRSDAKFFFLLGVAMVAFIIAIYFFFSGLVSLVKNIFYHFRADFGIIKNFAGNIKIENIAWKNGAIILTIVKIKKPNNNRY